MKKPGISRRRFVGTVAAGAGTLTMATASRLFASELASLAPTIKAVWIKAKEYTLEFANAMSDNQYGFGSAPCSGWARAEIPRRSSCSKRFC